MKQIGQASKSREEPLAAADAILRPIIIIFRLRSSAKLTREFSPSFPIYSV